MMNKELQRKSSLLSTSMIQNSKIAAHLELVSVNNSFVDTLKNRLFKIIKSYKKRKVNFSLRFDWSTFGREARQKYRRRGNIFPNRKAGGLAFCLGFLVLFFFLNPFCLLAKANAECKKNNVFFENLVFNLLISCFCLLNITLHAQPTINNNILPKIGDTVILASDNLPEGIAIFSEKSSKDWEKGHEDWKKGHQDWDFMDLQSAFSKKTAVKKVAKYKGDFLFPEADIKIEDLSGVENFYHLHKNELKLIGTKGVDPYGLGLEMNTVYDPAYVTLKTPIEYGDISNTSGRFVSELPANKLPITLLYSLPILPDSVRFISSIETSQEIDAWGHLVLPDNSFEVLRERRITAIKTRLEVKAGMFPWQDITDEIYTARFPKEQIKLSYHFYSNETSMPVAEVTMKPDGISAASITYIVTDPTSTMRNTDGQADIFAYPNPAISEVRFEFSNLPPARYTMKIFNILGVPVMEKSYQLSGFKTIKWDLSKLQKGTYLYSLVDDKGEPISTKRLMVIRP